MASDGYHLSLNLSRELWQELLASALPVELQKGELDLTRNAKDLVKQLGVRERVAGLLTDRQPPQALVEIADAAKLCEQLLSDPLCGPRGPHHR